MPVLAEAGSLAYAPQTPFIAFHALLVLAAANDPAAIRAIDVPGATEEQATTLRLIGEGLIALTEGEPRAALDCLLESLSGLPSIGGSRVQQEVVLETALAAMFQPAPGPGRPPVVPLPQHHPARGDLRCGELNCGLLEVPVPVPVTTALLTG